MKKLGKLVKHINNSVCSQFGHNWIWVIPQQDGPLVRTIVLTKPKESEEHVQMCKRCGKYRLKKKIDTRWPNDLLKGKI